MDTNVITAPHAAHPKYIDMVVEAIMSLNDRRGTSKQAISKYISGCYGVSGSHSVALKKSLRSALERGMLVNLKGRGATGSFKLSPEMKLKMQKKAKKSHADGDAAKKIAKKSDSSAAKVVKKSAAKKNTKKAAVTTSKKSGKKTLFKASSNAVKSVGNKKNAKKIAAPTPKKTVVPAGKTALSKSSAGKKKSAKKTVPTPKKTVDPAGKKA